MPCELKGFRGLDISKGVFWFPRKPFWVCLLGLYHPTTFSATCPILVESTRSTEDRYRLLLLNTGHAHCMLVTACRL